MMWKGLFDLIVRQCAFGCMLSVFPCSHGLPSDYVPETIPSLSVIDTDSAAKLQGVELIPVAVGKKSLHPDGEFTVRLIIKIGLFTDRLCSSSIELKIHDNNFDLVFSESIDLTAVSKFERLITIQRPNQLKLFAAGLNEQCTQHQNKLSEILVFDVNRIYAEIASKKMESDAKDDGK